MKPCVFGVDDAHWIDSDSWAFLLDLALEPNAILVITTRPLNVIDVPAMSKLLNHRQTKILTLRGLNQVEMERLACKFLNVDGIPSEMKQIISKRSHGIPLWCIELIETMLELQYIELTTEEVAGLEKESDDELSFQSNNAGVQIASGISLGDIPIPDSVAGMVLTRINRMSPDEQMTLKCAAIAGTVFKRRMLKGIVPNFHSSTFNASLEVLAEAGIIECAVAAEIRHISSDIDTKPSQLSSIPLHLHCKCIGISTIPLINVHQSSYPSLEGCQTLQFVHHYYQETAYNLWTENQKRSLHESAALFLESQARKCKNCGGGEFIAGGLRSTAFNRKKLTTSRQPYVGPTAVPPPRKEDQDCEEDCEEDYTQAMEIDRSSGGRSSRQGPSDPSDLAREDSDHVSTMVLGSDGEKIQLQLNKLFSSEVTTSMNMEDCYCNEVIAEIYPQLVRHWQAAGNIQATIMYLIEAGSGTVATGNNMEALSLLHEAKEILEKNQSMTTTTLERGRLESLIGQVRVSIGHVRVR